MVTHVQASPYSHSFTAPSWPRRVGRAIWRTLQAIGARRARRELTHLAFASEHTNPELAAHLRRVIREDWLSRG